MELVDQHVAATLVEADGSHRHRQIDGLHDGRAWLLLDEGSSYSESTGEEGEPKHLARVQGLVKIV